MLRKTTTCATLRRSIAAIIVVSATPPSTAYTSWGRSIRKPFDKSNSRLEVISIIEVPQNALLMLAPARTLYVVASLHSREEFPRAETTRVAKSYSLGNKLLRPLSTAYFITPLVPARLIGVEEERTRATPATAGRVPLTMASAFKPYVSKAVSSAVSHHPEPFVFAACGKDSEAASDGTTSRTSANHFREAAPPSYFSYFAESCLNVALGNFVKGGKTRPPLRAATDSQRT